MSIKLYITIFRHGVIFGTAAGGASWGQSERHASAERLGDGRWRLAGDRRRE